MLGAREKSLRPSSACEPSKATSGPRIDHLHVLTSPYGTMDLSRLRSRLDHLPEQRPAVPNTTPAEKCSWWPCAADARSNWRNSTSMEKGLPKERGPSFAALAVLTGAGSSTSTDLLHDISHIVASRGCWSIRRATSRSGPLEKTLEWPLKSVCMGSDRPSAWGRWDECLKRH